MKRNGMDRKPVKGENKFTQLQEQTGFLFMMKSY